MQLSKCTDCTGRHPIYTYMACYPKTLTHSLGSLLYCTEPTPAIPDMTTTARPYWPHGPYLTLSTPTQASLPPSNPHPKGPKSHSAQINHFTFPPFPSSPSFPGSPSGKVMVDEVSGLENPMLSNVYGSGTCQNPCELLSEEGKGDEVSFGS
jgi:hypothetical protein